MKNSPSSLRKFVAAVSVLSVVFFSASPAFAADGSGTHTVSPNTATASSTGNTHTFTYTASETMDSGELSMTAPAGWTAPQGTNGTAGYTTATSASGIIADVVNAADTHVGWTAPPSYAAVDTVTPQEGTGSLKFTIPAASVAGEQIFINNAAAENWGGINSASSNLRVGFWVKSSIALTAGDVQFQVDDTASLASPLDTINLPALTANTWTYTSIILGATTRPSVLSYGIKLAVDKGAFTLNIDAFGPMFDPAGANNWVGDANITVSTQTSGMKEGTSNIRCTYAAGAGTGTSGDCYQSNATPIVQGPGTEMNIWIRSSVALNSGDFSWVADGNTALASPEETVNLPALTANTWTNVTVTVPNSDNKSTQSYGLRQNVDKGAMTLDIDAMDKIVQTGDTMTGWVASAIQTLSTDTTVFHEGGASIKDVITAAASAGERFYDTFSSAQDWSGKTTVGFWIRSTVAESAGGLQFQYASTEDLTSPIATLNVSALTANTWTYQKLTLTGTRTSVKSYGIKYTTDVGAATINVDDFLIGPGSITFPGGGVVKARILALANGQTIVTTYGAGGGASGATAPSSPGATTFTTQTRVSDSGTLTNITTSPVITVTSPPSVTGVSSSTANGTYTTGTVIPIQVTFSQAVTVTGTPQITLSTGSPATTAINYTSGSGSTVLTFNYTVAAGNTSADLDYASVSALALNSGTIKDTATGTVNATLTLAAPAAAGSLGANKAIVIDTTADAAPGTPDMTAATDLGSSNTDNTTSDSTPDFTISCVTGSTVTLYDNTTAVGSGLCASSTVTITASTLTAGTHATMNAKQADPVGNVSVASGNLSIVIDTTADAAPGAPDMTAGTDLGSSSTDNTTSDATPDFTISCVTGSTVTLYDNTTAVGTGVCASSTVTITASTLTAGTHASMNAKQTDVAGNVSVASGNLSIVIDTTADAAPGTPDMTAATDLGSSSTDNTTSDATPDFTISCVSGSTVTLYDNVTSVGTGVCAGGTVTITASTLSAGTHATMNAKQTDVAGNVSIASGNLSIVIDTTADAAPGTPDMTAATDLGSSSTDNTTADATPDFTMSCVTGSTVTLYDNVTSVGTGICAGGTVTITASTLSAGTHATMNASQTDVAGNISAASGNLSIVIDTTADAAPGTPDMTTGTDTGASNTDNITSDTTPDFTMSCVSGSTVTLYDNITAVGTGVCAGGTVTITASTLSGGTHATMNATQTDVAGNVSIASGNLSVTIDTTADAAPGTPDMTAGTDTGASSTDNITSDTTPDFTMSCVTGSTVTLYDNVTSVGTGVCAGGTVTITASTLTAGTHATMNAKQTDPAGNVSVASGNLSIVIDTTAPTVATVTPVPTPANDATPDFTFSSNEAGTITYGGSCTSATTSAINGNTTVTFSTLADGTYANCTVTVTDAAGNVSTTLTIPSFTIDTTPDAAPSTPDMTAGTDLGSSSTDNTTSDATPDFTMSCVSGSTVTLYDNVTAVGSGLCAGGTVTITASILSSGTHATMNAKQTDPVGNVSVASGNLSIIIDTTADAAPGTPDMTAGTDLGSSSTDNITSDNTPDFTMSCVSGSTVTLYDNITAVGSGLCAGGTVTITASTLSSGTHATMNAKQTDVAGNVSIASGNLSVTIDTTADAAPGTPDMTAATDLGSSSTDNTTSDATPDFTMSCVTGSTVTLYDNTTAVGTGVCAGSTVTITASTLSAGTHATMNAKQTDPAGNVSVASGNLSIVIDTTAPTVATVTPVPTPANDATPDFTFSSNEAGTITYGGSCSSATTSAINGNTTVTFSTLADGTYVNCTITVTDTAGNVSTTLTIPSFTIDTTPDAAPGTPDMTAATDSGASSTDNITSDNTPDFTMSCVTGSTVTLYDNTTAVGSGLCAGGTVTITASTLSSGTHATMNAKQTDSVGNVSVASGNLSIVIDTTADAAPGTPDMTAATDSGASSTDNITNDNTPDFTISCVTGSTVTLYDNTTAVGSGVCAGSTVTITASTLSSGTHATMNATQTDVAGNISVASGNLSVVIDTTADAAPGTPDMTAGTDLGSSSTDNTTSDATPDFTMTCVTGSTVTLYDNVTSVGTGVCAGGTVTITASTLSSGTHATMNAKQTDPAGNVSIASGNLSIVIDTTADAAPGTPDMTAGTDLGSSSTDNITSDNTPDFTMSCVTGSTVTLYDNTTAVGSGLCAGGTVTITASTLTAGTHATMNAKQTDPAGNVSVASGNLSITIDATAPTVAVVTPVATPANDTTPDFIFSSNEAGTITYGGSCSSADTSAISGNNTVTFSTLAAGTYSDCTITVTDIAGNVSSTLTVPTFVIDTAAPDTVIDSAPTGSVSSASTSITFHATETSTFECKLDAGAYVSCVSPKAYTGLAEGSHTFLVRATDVAGNTDATPATATWTVDTTAPTLAVVTPVVTPSNDTTPDFTFSTTEAGTITYGGSCSSADASATSGDNTVTFSTLAAGTYSDCTVTVTDAAGNVSATLTVPTFVIDLTAPTLAVVTPVVTPSNDTTPDFTFSTTEAGTITYGGSCSSATSSATSGNNTVTFSSLTSGTHSDCTITVTDAAGNVSSVLSIPSFVVDTSAPSVTVVTPVTTPTNDPTPDFIFNTTEGGTITYGGSCSSATTVATDGDNTVTFNALADGLYNDCTVTVTDAAGNVSNTRAVPSFTIDTVAPSLTVVTAILTPGRDATPTFVFNTDEAGDITYGGSCAANPTHANAGDKSITFQTLADGTYSDCTITLTDSAGNVSAPLSVPTFVIDKVAPTVVGVSSTTANGAYTVGQVISVQVTFDEPVEVTGVPGIKLATGTPVSTTVDYVSGSGTSVLTFEYTVVAGNATSDLDYAATNSLILSGGTIKDPAGNNANRTLAIPGDDGSLGFNKDIVIDTDAPTLAVVTAVPVFTNDTTPDFTFSTDEAGAITYGGSCSAATASATSGNNTVTFAALVAGTYSDCTITVTDAAGNVSATLAVPSFTIDLTAPTLAVVTPVPTPANDATPDFTFSTTEAGTITYGGSCASATTSATSGNNTVTFATLAAGTYADCTITVTDAAGNVSATLDVPSFTIDLTAPTLAVVTAVPTPANDATPDFTFSTTEAGTITYGGSCASATTSATSGNNTVTFNALAAGTYSDCTIRVTDAAGNLSSILSVPTFVIDLTAPTLAVVTPVPTPSNDATPTFVFSSTEAGTITYGGSCSAADTSAASGDNVITFSTLIAGTYSDCTVTVTDAAGNVSSTLTVPPFTIDLTAPDTVIDSAPSGTVNTDAASITFHATETSTFECKLDAGVYASCTSPKAYVSLSEGSHTFSVRATDGAGNVDASAATATWTVDTIAPNTVIDSAPSGTVNTDAASITFHSTEGGSTFECDIDGLGYASCTSPKAYTGLAQGSHTFSVRATDGAGNTDTSPDTATWTVDTIAPDTSITSSPANPVSSTSASFAFTSTEAGSTFECKLDAGAYVACTSPKAYTGLTDGSHTFLVRATDGAGNVDASPASYTWTVDTTDPNTIIDSAPTGTVNSTSASITFHATETSTFECKLDAGSYSACTSPASYTGLAQGSHTFTVRATDTAGNTDATPATATWTIDSVAPTLAVVTAVPTPDNDTTPNFTFSTTEAGTITYGGSCSSATTSATSGNNTVTFVTLAAGTYSDCTVTVTDGAGNASAPLAVPTFVIDTTAPVLAVVTPVTTPTNDTTPDFTFSTTEAGAITYGGSCSSATTSATSGNNTVTFAALVAGTYSDCTVTVTDAAGNASSALSVPSFTIDTSSPLVSDVTSSLANGSYKAGQVVPIQVIFSSVVNVTGTPRITLSTGSPATTAIDYVSGSGSTTLVFNYTVVAGNFSADLDYAATTSLVLNGGSIKDAATNNAILTLAAPGAAHSLGGNRNIIIDTSAPTLAVVTPVPTFTSDTTPNFTFSSSEAGAITYGGSCASVTASATSGNNTITLNALVAGTYSDCTVSVTDAAGNVSSALAIPPFTIDVTAPDTIIDSAPTGTVTVDTASLTFHSTEAGSTFECKLDAGAYASCTSPKNYTGLSDGSHTFMVRATDAAGNVDASAATASWTVDTAAPDTVIDTAPTGTVNSADASITFHSTEAGSTFECDIDGLGYASCTSPKAYSGLSEGSHTFSVKATDAAGNADATPDTATWTVDTAAPDTTITSTPSDPTSSTSASFAFTSTEAGSTFECKLDAGAYVACTSPKAYTGLADGSHTFTVRATDAAGNTDATPDTYTWTVDTTAPNTIIDSAPTGTVNSTSASITFHATETSTFQCKLDAGAYSLCTSPASYTGLSQGSHTFLVKATDLAGNVDATPATASWTIDTAAPMLAVVTAVPTPDNDTTPNFTFSTTEAGTITYGGSCASSTTAATSGDNTVTFNALVEGTYSDCTVTVTDSAGNASSPLAVPAFVIDTTAPDTLIDTAPSGTVTVDTASIAFHATEASTFQCAIDGGAYAACTSPKSYTNLAEGSHTFTVKATDAAGNTDASAASATWIVDTVAPNTIIDSAPTGTVNVDTADIVFHSTEVGSTFECKLDGGAYGVCVSSAHLTGLADGSHTYLVRAIDGAGNVDATPASATWTVDTGAPDTSITSSPSNPSISSSASFAFTSTEAGSTFECSMDAGAFASCTSPKAYTGLTDGSHTFSVRATDSAGNTDASPATYTWTIDTTDPNTIIDTAPTGTVNSTSASITFHATETSTFECKLDAGSYSACTSPASYTGLAQGSHTFTVRATDTAGNTDATPATATWTIDTVAPNTIIDSAPTGTVNSAAASLTFHATEAGSTFECDIDGLGYASCTSPKAYTGLTDGSHTFSVRATDSAGNVDASAATATWIVDTGAPDTSITSSPSNPSTSTSASFAFTATETSTFECQLDGGAFASCTSPKSYTSLAQGSHTFSVRATDSAGNTDASPATYTWVIDTVAPDTIIDSAPSGTVNSTSASITFHATETSTFECKLDAGAYSLCTSPATYTGLSQGSHTFTVRATDSAGNVDASPATATWTIDTAAPTLAVVTPVPTPDNDTTPDFTFSSTEAGTITYGGSCSAADTTATVGNNTVTFSTLASGTYADCTVTVTDSAGNASAPLAVPTFVIDTTAPVLAVVTPVATPTGDTTPDFTFSSTEAGTITYGGSCSSATSSATSGNNTVTFNALAQGTYTNCTVKVTDSAGNQSNVLAVPSFTIDTSAPVLAVVTPVPTPSNDTTPTFVFSSTKAGTITFGGSCSSSTTSATTGDNSVTFDALVAGTYSNCTVKVTDGIGNQSNVLFVPTFVIDTTAPVLAVVTPVPTPGSDTTPNFTFSTTEAGTITYGGSCSAADTSATTGNNTVTFNALANGTYSDCTVTVTDASGNASAPLSVPTFVIDTTAPVLAVVTPVATPTNDPTPDFIFSSTEAGTITYGGSCSSATTAATSGNNTVTFNTLATGTYTNCTVKVTDAAGNQSNVLAVPSFTIDATAPTLAVVTPVPTPSNDTTPTFVFSSDEAGTITYGGSCSAADTSAIDGDNTITFNALPSGTYSNCTIVVTDAAGNASSVLHVPTFTIDATAPILAVVTPVPTPDDDTTPTFVFSSTEAGPITYGGSCDSNTTTAVSGTNTINFTYLLPGTYADCTIVVTDAAGNPSLPLAVPSFTINVPPPPATRFVIIDPVDAPVGSNVNVTIQALKGDDTLASTFDSDVTLAVNGSATIVGGVALVHVTNGVGTAQITDTTAETVMLSLSDSQATGLDVSSTQDETFTAGALHHFTFANVDTQTAGQAFDITMTAKDQYGNVVSSYAGTVALTIVPSAISPSTSGTFAGGTRTESVTVNQAGTNRVITATNVGGSEAGSSNSFDVLSGASSLYLISDPGDMTAGSRIGYTVIRKDAFNNLVQTSAETVYLYHNSTGPNAAFYDAAANGNQVTSVVIPAGQSQAHFWYYDDTVGNVNVTVSDNSSAPDGAAGVADATDPLFVSDTPIVATKFVIIVQSSATVGDTVPVIVRAVNDSGQMDTSYTRANNTVKLHSSGSATASGAGIAVSVTNGEGQVNISDTAAETATLTVDDTTNVLNDSDSQNVVFDAGALHHFAFAPIGTQTAGVSFSDLLTAQDQYGNTITSFSGTANLSVDAGDVFPIVTQAFTAGIAVQNISVTAAGPARVLTATRTGGSEAGNSAPFPVLAGSTYAYSLNAPSDVEVDARAMYMVTRKDAFGNLVTAGAETVNLFSTSPSGTFHDAASAGSEIGLVVIPNGQSSATFWYSDTVAGNWIITVSDSAGIPDGNAGIHDGTDSITITPAVIATRFIVIASTGTASVGTPVVITVKAVNVLSQVDVAYQNDVTLSVSGSATIVGGIDLVDIVNGQGTLTINDTVAESVLVSLIDSASTGLDVTTTDTVTYNEIASHGTTGGSGCVTGCGGIPPQTPPGTPPPVPEPTPAPAVTEHPASISFNGQAFPAGLMSAFVISNGQVPLKQDTIKQANGKFGMSVSTKLSDATLYGLIIYDKLGRPSQAKIFTLNQLTDILKVQDMLMSPSIDVRREIIAQGDFLTVLGYAAPGNTLEFEIDGKVLAKKLAVPANGNYQYLYNTNGLGFGNHSVRVRQINPAGQKSDFSIQKWFELTDYIITASDLNKDGQIDVRDSSIFIALWYNEKSPQRLKIDLNGDGKVDIQDFSIYVRTLQKLQN